LLSFLLSLVVFLIDIHIQELVLFVSSLNIGYLGKLEILDVATTQLGFVEENFTQQKIERAEFPVWATLGIEMNELVPLNEYAEFEFPNRSVVKVAPLFVPLFPLPLMSFALPVNG
jgi:hypothetical protein